MGVVKLKVGWLDTPFDEIALAKAIIKHYERMIDGWEDTLRTSMGMLVHEGDSQEELSGEEVYDILVEQSRDKWGRINWSTLVPRDTMQRWLDRDMNAAMRYIKFLHEEDEDNESSS